MESIGVLYTSHMKITGNRSILYLVDDDSSWDSFAQNSACFAVIRTEKRFLDDLQRCNSRGMITHAS